MIKKITIISFILLLITSLLSLFTYQDDMDIKIPNIELIFIIITIAFGTLLAIKLIIKWQAIKLSLNNEGYQINKKGVQNSIVYDAIHLIFFFLVGSSLLLFVPEIWFVGFILILYVVEGIAFIIFNLIYRPYKIIVTKDSIITINNSLNILHWNTIKKIEENKNDIHLINKLSQTYVFDLNLLSKNDALIFKNNLKSLAKDKGLYFGACS